MLDSDKLFGVELLNSEAFDFDDLRSFEEFELIGSLAEEASETTSEDILSGNDSGSPKLVATSRVRGGKRTLTDNRPVGENGGVYFKRRSNGRLVTHVVYPKIVKGDVRRGYGTIMCNVLNSQDINIIQRFFRDFCTPNTSFRHRFPESAVVLGNKEITLVGLTEMQAMWSKLVMTTPDIVFKPGDGQLRVRSDGTSTVQLSFTIQGTNIISDEFHKLGVRMVAGEEDAQAVEQEPLPNDANTLVTSISKHRFIVGFKERFHIDLLSSKRNWMMQFSGSGTLTLSLDELDRILSFSIEVSCVV